MQKSQTPHFSAGETQSPDNQPSASNHATPFAAGGAAAPVAAMGGADSENSEDHDESSPRMVIRGESFQYGLIDNEGIFFKKISSSGRLKLMTKPIPKADAEPLAAITDYLNVSFPFVATRENITQLVKCLGEYLGEPFDTLEKRKGGFHGYKDSFKIGTTGGLFACGGQNNTGYVSLPGASCALIKDWHRCYDLFCSQLQGRITRWDGAVDLFDGSPSVDDAAAMYLDGQFNSRGNKPSTKQSGNWLTPDTKGRTLYIGKRENGKMLRIYEKGKQLGNPDSHWVRWELELHNNDRLIPWDVILQPGKYIAGSYDCMAWVNEKQERIKTTQKAVSISYGHLVHCAQLAYGGLFKVMLEVEGSAEKVLALLVRNEIPKRLKLDNQSTAELITPKTENPQKTQAAAE